MYRVIASFTDAEKFRSIESVIVLKARSIVRVPHVKGNLWKAAKVSTGMAREIPSAAELFIPSTWMARYACLLSVSE